MKNKLLIVGLLSVTKVAIADVSLYGRVAVAMQQDAFPGSTIASATSVQDYGSYFGIRGYDQVYGQTSAIWQIEQFVDLASGQAFNYNTGTNLIIPRDGLTGVQNGRNIIQVNTLASSETYLGLQGLWGRIRLGNLSNYMRSSMGAVDLYSYANGANGASMYSRTNRVLPSTIRFDSPNWDGFSFALGYSFQSTGQGGVYGLSPVSNFGGGINGFYAGGVYSLGLSYARSNFSIRAGTMIIENVGTYTNQLQSNFNPLGNVYPGSSYTNSYVNRLEIGYNDPDDLILGIGAQASSGWGYNGWATSGGSWGNYIVNPGYNYAGLSANQYQLLELAGSFGWHLGAWTPKISYIWGSNLMYNSNVMNVTFASGNQIPNSGYNQLTAELDWNITPRTIVFINYGQIWFGDTMRNVAFCGNNCANVSTITAQNRYVNNQGTGSIGFSHTF